MLDNNKRSLDKLPSEEVINSFKELVNDLNNNEVVFQNFFQNQPEMLVPLELSEFIRHLRYEKRDHINPSIPLNKNAVRVPDFDGVKLMPFSYPVIIEIKKPFDKILDPSTKLLSEVSKTVISQLINATIEMLRSNNRNKRLEIFGKPLEEIIDDLLLMEFEQMDLESNLMNFNEASITDLMKKLIDEGCGFIALIGNSNEFKENPEFLIHARKLYSEKGVLLLTFDELIFMNEVISDFFSSNNSLLNFFNDSKWVKNESNTIFHKSGSLVFPVEIMKKLQEIIYNISTDVCFYGFGIPPNPTRTGEEEWAVWEANTSFNVGMLLAKPTFLKGDERLLWAGKYQEYWLVVKERLNDPLKDGIVWYIFQPPSEKQPII